MVSFFQPWGQYKAIKVQHLLVTWGQIENIYSISALTPNAKPVGADFNLCINRNA
jgi:hypothetical protein